MTGRPVRVAVCSASYAYGRGLGHFLDAHPALQVVLVANDASGLLADLPTTRPDLVAIDAGDRPGDAAETVRRVREAAADATVVVFAGEDPAGGLRAAGAALVCRKQTVRLDAPGDEDANALRAALVAVVRNPREGGRPPREAKHPPSTAGQLDPVQPVPTAPIKLASSGTPATVVAIAASAGGPRALRTVLEVLPAGFPLPVLVVQHMADGFTEGLVASLDRLVSLPVRIATHRAPLAPGVHVAPEGQHLALGPGGRTLTLSTEPSDLSHRPSADVLLRSLAREAGSGAVAAVLTGMGRDGELGVREILAAGGTVLAEDASTAAVWGMPQAAAREGAQTLTLEHLAAALRSVAEPR